SADAGGGSTVPEVIVANHAGMNVLGICVIANVNNPDNFQPILLENVIENAEKAQPQLELLIHTIISSL
ncbi:MAG: purine-nucleoside phosphorylase, partial [Bacteroidetes bacterium]|nr:purine-nucleoside phosphorylase [Bacteroidota bacterium]